MQPLSERNIHLDKQAGIFARSHAQQYYYIIAFNHSCTRISSGFILHPGLKNRSVSFRPFLSTCPKSYTFEILGCLQAVTPLLKFMPQFHSVTPLICSGSQETGQAGASGESQPWVPKGQGETQAARPNRKQLRSSCDGEPFR